MRFLRIEGRKTVREVAKICSISPASVVRIIRKPVVGGGERSRAEFEMWPTGLAQAP